MRPYTRDSYRRTADDQLGNCWLPVCHRRACGRPDFVLPPAYPDGVLDQFEFFLKTREPSEQFGICHLPRTPFDVTQRSNPLQESRADFRGREPVGVRDLRHLTLARAAPVELFQDYSSYAGWKRVQGKRLIQRHMVYPMLKQACDGRV